MKNLKKLSGILLAIAVLLACTVTAFADGSTAEANTGKITVDNPVAENTYTAYKIFDVSYTDADVNSKTYAYTIANDSKWYNVVNTYANTAESGLTLTESAIGGITNKIYNVTIDSGKFSAAKFAAHLRDNKPDDASGVTLDVTDGKAEKTGLPLGYYFVSTTSGTIANLTTTNPTVTIHDKNDFKFTKSDGGTESVQVGDTVRYTITGKVPDTTGYSIYTYEIEDTMTEGLTFTETDLAALVVKVDGVADNTNVHKTFTNNGFKLKIDVTNLQDKVGKDIVVTYTAKVNDKAVAKVSYNQATLTYHNDPTSATSTTTAKQIETVYSAQIEINKVDSADDSPLANATFVLKNSENKYYKHENNVVSWVDTVAAATKKTTLADGKATFDGLEDGTYYLVETAAPDGYNLLEEEKTVTVNGTKAADGTTSVTLKYDSDDATVKGALIDTVTVENSTGSILPSTGGIGTTIFYIVGGVLVAAAVVLLVAKKRTSENR